LSFGRLDIGILGGVIEIMAKEPVRSLGNQNRSVFSAIGQSAAQEQFGVGAGTCSLEGAKNPHTPSG
jgi:hypothetical protein